MEDLAIGIDLGTTYCCVAVYRDGKVEIIPNSVGTNTTPSYVHINEDDFVTAGTAAKGLAQQDPTRAVYDVKRLIGRRFNDPLVLVDMKIWPFKVTEDEDTHFPRICLNETSYLPEQISAYVLEYLKKCAEEWLRRPVKKAVITVPAYFNEAQRHATKIAGSMAGLEVLNLFHEPTAAAVFYCYKNKSLHTEKTILVFDLGGGTFDVVVMNIKDRQIQIKSIGGNSHLGGQDIDRNLVDHCLEEFKARNGIDLNSVGSERDKVKVARILRRLKTECEEIKTQLSYNKKSVISLDNLHGDTSLVVKITREEFENLNESLFQQCVNTVISVVKDAKLTPEDIDEVIMVGGSSRIPRLQELIMELFLDKKPNKKINADEAVACGAAIQAALMTTHCPTLKNIFPDIKIRDRVSSSVVIKPYTAFVTNTRPAGSLYKEEMEIFNPKSAGRTNIHVDNSGSESGMDNYKQIRHKAKELKQPDEIYLELQIIANSLIKKDVKEITIAWRHINQLTQEHPGNCESFLEHHGIERFLKCLNTFPYENSLKGFSMCSLNNVAEVEHLRPQLMTSELITVFYNFLDSTDLVNRVSYYAAWFITHILSDGVAAWTIGSLRRSDALNGIRRSVTRWEKQSTYYCYGDMLQPSLKLLNHTNTTECQLLAAWSLKNFTKIFPSRVPELVEDGGLDILKKMRCEDEEVRKFVNMTLKLGNDF